MLHIREMITNTAIVSVLKWFGKAADQGDALAQHKRDNPHATRLTLHILAAVAEHEREMISVRTKAALAAAKARGKALGRHGAEILAPAYKAAAQARAEELRPILTEIAGRSTRAIAAELTARGIPTPRGGRWQAQSVANVLRHLAATAA